MKRVAFVPIRLNSQRVKGKNLRDLGGRPLLAHILDSLLAAPSIDEVYVYCSNPVIREYLPAGVKFLQRDVSLDSDTTLGADIYDAFTQEVYADIYILAHTTSPFIRPSTIEEALHKVECEGYDSAFSAKKEQSFVWWEGRPLNYSLSHIPRTQSLEPVYIETSAFFIFRREIWCEQHRRIGNNHYIATTDRIESIDIDNPDDFLLAEAIIKAELNR